MQEFDNFWKIEKSRWKFFQGELKSRLTGLHLGQSFMRDKLLPASTCTTLTPLSNAAQLLIIPCYREPDDILHRLEEFIELFLSNGLNSEFAYTFGLKNA